MSNIQIDAAVLVPVDALKSIMTFVNGWPDTGGPFQKAKDSVNAILRDHAAREQGVCDIGGNTKVCDKCMRLHKPDQTECFADTDAMNKKALAAADNALLPRPIHQHDFKGVVGMCSCGLSIYDYDKPPTIQRAFREAADIEAATPITAGQDTQTQSGECEPVCVCGHTRQQHIDGLECWPCRSFAGCDQYRDRARGGR